MPVCQLLKQGEQRTVFLETFRTVLRHRGAVVGRWVKRRIGRVTVGQQAVGKRRMCHETDAEFFDNGQ